MRRGWMDWLPQEVPQDLLDGRVARVAAACVEQGVDALALYASFTRPAQVSALTHFVPFWSQAVLVVTRDGQTLLAMATTGRTVQWIRSVSHVGQVLVGPEAGRVAGNWLAEHVKPARLAVANLDDVPQSVLDGLRGALPQAQLLDATGWYAPLEAGFGPAPAVAARCVAIAQASLAQVTAQASVHDIVGAVEGAARAQGAEEAMVWLAPDLSRSSEPFRLEGPATLGPRFAVQLTLAYKGLWVRVAASFEREGERSAELPASAQARALLRRCAAGTDLPDLLKAVAGAASGVVVDWSVQARRGGLPLACLAASDAGPCAGGVPAGATVSAQLLTGGQRLLVAEPVSFT